MECCQVQKNSDLGHQRKFELDLSFKCRFTSQWPAQAMIQHVQIPVAKYKGNNITIAIASI